MILLLLMHNILGVPGLKNKMSGLCSAQLQSSLLEPETSIQGVAVTSMLGQVICQILDPQGTSSPGNPIRWGE
ncbi:hypothetical protein Y1Q_0017458 [Alligator mississippiensis]|uniref:Uncharacterized protein n=1 Tax=Alligator mississippiensis TaxID=8496 RepID=A0A151P214_ALLMI|nr:hypothetical protein Y1Q_0017458 [Alligator mississippiensis]